jgi:ABC-2 type transport system ATP-binding protein
VLPGEFYGISGRELRARVAASLERFGLTDAADRLVRTYSGGMQRRLDIAMGLLHRPRVLFLDEPTTGLDPEARAELWREIERLASEELMTILLTTHYLEEADRLASRLAIVDRGRVVVEGTPDQLKSDLQGDTIQIELADPDDAGARAAIGRVGGVDEVELDGRTLRARAQDGGAAIPAVLAALEARGVKATSVTLARPSLDEVYLRHAGRTFDVANTKELAA